MKETHNPWMSAGCQCPGGTAIKSARREGLGRAAAGLVTNKTTRRVTAEALRREAVSARGSQRSSCPDSLSAGEPRRAGRQRLRVRSQAALPPAAFPQRSWQPGAGCTHGGAIGQARDTRGMTQGQPQRSDARARLPRRADGNESARSAEGCLSRIFGAGKNAEFLERAWPPAAVQTAPLRR